MKKAGDIAESLCSSMFLADGGVQSLFLKWDDVLGNYFSTICTPVKLKKDSGILLIKVNDPKRVLEIQYKEEIILMKINNFLQNEQISHIKVCV